MYIVQAYSIHFNCYMARTDNLAVVKMIYFLLLSCWYLGLRFGASPVSSSHKQETVKCTIIIDYSNQNFESLLPGSSFCCCVNHLLSLFLKIFVNWKVKPLNWSIFFMLQILNIFFHDKKSYPSFVWNCHELIWEIALVRIDWCISIFVVFDLKVFQHSLIFPDVFLLTDSHITHRGHHQS